MKSLCISLLFIHIFLFRISGQEPFPNGTYMGTDELNNRTPSEQYEVMIINKWDEEKDKKYSLGNNIEIESADGSVKKKVFKQDIVAICQNEKLYINCNYWGLQKGYSEVFKIEPGRLLFFNAATEQSDAVGARLMFGVAGGLATRNKKILYVYSVKKSQVFNVKDLIEDKFEYDPTLKAEFKEEYEYYKKTSSNEVLIKYFYKMFLIENQDE